MTAPAAPSAHRLAGEQWRRLATEHAARADALTAGHLARRQRGQRHAVEDFLYDYYGTRPSVLRRWHPGVGRTLEPDDVGPPEHAAWRWYRADAGGGVHLDVAAYLADRSQTVDLVLRLLTATADRPAFLGCFGLHEWAMVYRADDRRHPLPLRLGRRGTDTVVESHQIRCTHYDAFRFFTPDAVPLNRVQPARGQQADLEQPGCLHAGMDCHKWATKLGPAVPGELALDCFELAGRIRRLDMAASPYDMSSYGVEPVPIETAEGKAEYVARQRVFSERSGVLRRRLLDVCEALRQP